MKKIGVISLMTALLCFGMGSSNVPSLETEAPIDENERAMSHINYIQYELAKIRQSADKMTATKELDDVLNTINSTSLKHERLSDAYVNILSSMVEIRATDEQKDALKDELAKKRKNAIFNSFSGLGAAFLNPNPVSIASALIMSGFNYARTINEINIEGDKESLKLSQTQRDRIDKQRIDLWKAASDVFVNSKYESTTFINDKMMTSYVENDFDLERAMYSKKASATATRVQSYLSKPEVENQFRFFIPYYVTLLKCAYAKEDAVKIEMYYKKIVNLSNAEYKNFYTKNPYLFEATKYVLIYLMQHENKEIAGIPIDQIIEIFKKEGDKSNNISTIEDEYFLIGVYEYLNKKKNGGYYVQIKNSLKYLVDQGVENDTTDLYSKYKCLESKKQDNDYCYRLAKKVAKDQLRKVEYIVEDGNFVISFPLDASVSAKCTDRDQGTIFIDALDRREERTKCNKSVEKFQKQKNGSSYRFVAEQVPTLEHEKINLTIDFKMGQWNASAYGVWDYKEEFTKPLELKNFSK